MASRLLLLQIFNLGDDLFGVREAAAEDLLQHAAAATRDDLAVHDHVELAEAAELTLHGNVEGVFNVRSETRCAWAEASRGAVQDGDVHDRLIGHPSHRHQIAVAP